MTDLTAIGEILIDLTQTGVNEQGVSLFAANPGGAPANVAVAAARLGARCAFWGKVGKDGLGDLLEQALTDNGVDASGLLRGERPTTMAVVTVSPEGERSFRFLRGADQDLSPGDILEKKLRDTKILHFGSVSLTAGLSRSATLFAARQAKTAGALVSYDPNFRPSLWPSEESALQWMSLPLPLVDIIKLSEEELPLVAGSDSLQAGSRALADRGVSLVLVTLGPRGVFYRWRDTAGLVPGVETEVMDTNGAGDTFFGAVLSRLALRSPAPLEGLETDELEDILSFANRAASLTCSRSGAIPAMPTLDEVERNLSSR